MNYVVYKRVSTVAQGQSGLGLDGQALSIQRFLAANGGQAVAEFTEIESGKRADRPQLKAAILLCQRHGHKLLVAKLDRLARNLHFITTLQQSKIDFVAVDNPHATPFVIQILCAVAEQEALAISQRTKSALEAAKRRGIQLGAKNPQATLPLALAAIQTRKTAYNESMLKVIREIQAVGITSLKGLAAALEKRGERTSRGGTRWTATAVRRVLLNTK
jgi:DNA invertase Pin-like site-specific DNA recombinase